MVATLRRVAAVYRDVGVSGVARRLVRKLKGTDRAWAKAQAAVDAAFDAKMGTETGIRKVADLVVVGDNARYAVDHIASDPRAIQTSLAKLAYLPPAQDLSQYTFIDLGSGSGRALILAASYPFKCIIGVEFAVELHEAAQRNTARYPQVELVNADATLYQFPDTPLIIYMFNPFGAVIVRKVSENLLASYRANPRQIQIIYANPVHLSQLVGWKLIDNGDPARLIPGD